MQTLCKDRDLSAAPQDVDSPLAMGRSGFHFEDRPSGNRDRSADSTNNFRGDGAFSANAIKAFDDQLAKLGLETSPGAAKR